MKKVALGIIGAACLGFAAPASADVVCNDDGDCWRVKEKYTYEPNFGVTVYADDWEWDRKESRRYRWRDAGPGRGYYRSGVWIEF